ncbi:MAG: hypothetical protein V4596_07790 [Bdellovibrionota bacterium]
MSKRNLRVLILIIVNLVLGNSILYIHEIYLRKQEQFDMSWSDFSLIAVLLLIPTANYLKDKKPLWISIAMSLVLSYLIPVLGFFVSMRFSLIALIGGASYLFLGFFYFVFPMFIVNAIMFRWIQKKNFADIKPIT